MAKEMIKEMISELGLELSEFDIKSLGNYTYYIQRLNFPYLDCLNFQEKCVELVYKNPKLSIFIGTNHPECLTLGRGLQRKPGDNTVLIDYDPNIISKIEVPLYEIRRGGGVTFHHPGQIVIYPIVNLTFHKLNVYELMSNLFRETVVILNHEVGEYGYDYCRDLLGLWVGSSKVASIGLQVRRFVTFHGMALNVKSNKLINDSLNFIHPCGLPGDRYTNLEKVNKKDVSSESLFNAFSQKIDKALIKIKCV